MSLFYFDSAHGDRGKHELPGNNILSLGFIPLSLYESVNVMNSERMHPALHISMLWSYYFYARIISGALYHRETTWGERFLLLGFFKALDLLLRRDDPDDWIGNDLAMPKSQILTSHLELRSKFAGLMSRWIMLAVWTKFNAHRNLYIT